MNKLIAILSFLIILGLGGMWLFAQPQALPKIQKLVHAQPATSSFILVSSTAAFQVRATSTHVIGQITLSPTILTQGSAQPITVTALISDPALIATSVNLILLQTGSPTTTIVGTLHDDGLRGDLIAGDSIFSLVFALPMATTFTGPISFEVSAAFRGALNRTKSALIPVIINQPTDLSGWVTLSDSRGLFTMSTPQGWNLHIVEIQNPDAYTVTEFDFLFPDGTSPFAIDMYTPDEWQLLSAPSNGITPLFIGKSLNYYFALAQSQDIEGSQGFTADQVLGQLPAVYATFHVH